MYIDDAKQAIAYLRKEADFNRSWVDGRRGNVSMPIEYQEARLRAAADRIRWAEAIETLMQLASVRKP